MANHRITIFPVMQKCKLIKPFGVERSLLLPCVSHRKLYWSWLVWFFRKITSRWRALSRICRCLFEKWSAFFLRLYFVDGEVQFDFSLYDDSIRDSDSKLRFQMSNFNNNFNKKFLLWFEMYIFYSFKASKNTMPLLKQFLQYRKCLTKLKRKSLGSEVNIL